MKQRKQLYDKAKHYQIEEAWAGYRKLKNEITKEIDQAHESYQKICLIAKLILTTKYFGNTSRHCIRIQLE